MSGKVCLQYFTSSFHKCAGAHNYAFNWDMSYVNLREILGHTAFVKFCLSKSALVDTSKALLYLSKRTQESPGGWLVGWSVLRHLRGQTTFKVFDRSQWNIYCMTISEWRMIPMAYLNRTGQFTISSGLPLNVHFIDACMCFVFFSPPSEIYFML